MNGGSVDVKPQTRGVLVSTKERLWPLQENEQRSISSMARRYRTGYPQKPLLTALMSDRRETYIYESPDGGDTVYRRKTGSVSRELHTVSEKKKNLIEELREQSLWGQIRRASRTDPALKEMLDQIEVYWHLKNLP